LIFLYIKTDNAGLYTFQSVKPGRYRMEVSVTGFRVLKVEEVWLNEYQSLDQARDSIGRWIHQYNHQRPHQSLQNRTPAATRRAFTQPQPLTYSEALCV
jgi:transposase InsO family protein